MLSTFLLRVTQTQSVSKKMMMFADQKNNLIDGCQPNKFICVCLTNNLFESNEYLFELIKHIILI